MKTRGLIIILIMLLLVIIITLICFLFFSLTKGITLFEKKESTIIVDKTYEIKEINNIEVLSNAGDVFFEESSDDKLRVVVYGGDNSDCKVSQNSNNLKIDYSQHFKNKWFNFNHYINDIIVYIPSSFSNEITVKNNYGDCKVGNLESATINIKLDCGDIEIEKARNVNLKCSYGDTKVGTILNKCEIKSNCGDIKLENLELKENSTIESDLGDVKIEKINDIYVDANVQLGDTKIEQNNRYAEITLKIQNNCGDIEVGQ